MKYDFVYYNGSKDLELAPQERSDLKKFFPNAKVDTMRKLGPATHDYNFEYTEGVPLPKVCEEYGCNIIEKKYLEITIDDSKKLIEVPSELCRDPKFHCLEFKTFSLSYNCIGWALGIRDWINPRFEDDRAVQKSNLNEFLGEVDTRYHRGHPKKVLPILDSLETKSEICLNPSSHHAKEYDVAFYFKDNELQHGSRYSEMIADKEIKSWTSKLGSGLLISHDLTDLDDNMSNSTYGVAECIGAVHPEEHKHDEL
jgi:hypothetical protein